MQTLAKPRSMLAVIEGAISMPGSGAAAAKREKLQQRREAIRAYDRERFRQRGFSVTAVRRDVLGRPIETPKPTPPALKPTSVSTSPPKPTYRPPAATRQPTKVASRRSAAAPKVRQLSKPAARSSYSDEMYASDCASLLSLLRLL